MTIQTAVQEYLEHVAALQRAALRALAKKSTPLRQRLAPAAATLSRSFARLRAFLPLSLRGLLISALSAFLLYYYALPASDLSATIVSSLLLIISIVLLLRGFFAARTLKRRLAAELLFDEHELFSQKDISAGIAIEGLRLPSLYRIRVERRFSHSGVDSARHYLRGRTSRDGRVRVLDSCRFAHRGNWELLGLEVRLQDFLGLTHFSWMLAHREIIPVQAPEAEVRPLPIVASSSQPGDLLQHTDNRTGDLFDIKPYDPSDGTKRILWKTYAKSRQLVVRRPEPAMVPEGEVAIYSLARREDDHVASAAIAYIEQLERNNIVVLFGNDTLPSTESLDFAHPFVGGSLAADAMKLDIWNPELGSGKGFARFVNALNAHQKYPVQIIFYIDKERLLERGPQSVVTLTTGLAENLGLQAVFVAVDESFLDPRKRLIKKGRGSLMPLRTGGPLTTTILEAERAEA